MIPFEIDLEIAKLLEQHEKEGLLLVEARSCARMGPDTLKMIHKSLLLALETYPYKEYPDEDFEFELMAMQNEIEYRKSLK